MSFAGYYTDGLIGEFKEADYGNWFEYKAAPNPIFGEGYPFLVAVGCDADGDVMWRYADVIKTRVYMVVDEDDNGPVIEKWVIRNHTKYGQE